MRPTGGLLREARERDDKSAQRDRWITVRAMLKKALDSAKDELSGENKFPTSVSVGFEPRTRRLEKKWEGLKII
jgi:hypothetical protein